MTRPVFIRIVEVGPRDGLQNEPRILTVPQRVAMIGDLVAAGLTVIEAGSFVPAARLPQMAATDLVLSALRGDDAQRFPVLVPNLKGLADAQAAGARDIAIFASASESFSRRNLNRSIGESLAEYEKIAVQALAKGMQLRGYVSCVLGCPYEGEVPVAEAVKVAAALIAMGCSEVSLGDTIGRGTPDKARNIVKAVAAEIGANRIALHFHDTYGQALANVLACLDLGVSVIDASVAGLGGCPYAPGASGNLATEDLVYMLNGLGVETGVDLDLLARAGQRACAALGVGNRSRAGQALLSGKEDSCTIAV